MPPSRERPRSWWLETAVVKSWGFRKGIVLSAWYFPAEKRRCSGLTGVISRSPPYSRMRPS